VIGKRLDGCNKAVVRIGLEEVCRAPAFKKSCASASLSCMAKTKTSVLGERTRI
jgi:hypothetical protein